MDVEAFKRDIGALAAVLGIQWTPRQKQYLCAFHNERTPSMNVKQWDGGVWGFKCFGCGAAGTIVDAIARRENKDPRIVYGELKNSDRPSFNYKPNVTPARPIAPKMVRPVLDSERVESFIVKSSQEIKREYESISRRYHRGISLEVIQRFNVGFRSHVKFEHWKRPVRGVWCLPVTDSEGHLGGIKLHREKPIPPKSPKCLWAPFGTEPKEDWENGVHPLHSYYDFFPAPECFEMRISDAIYLCPGELKALAMITLGYFATAFSGGESFLWHPWMAERFRNKNIIVIYDDDPDKEDEHGNITNAGRAFRDRAVHALYPVTRSLKSMTFGRNADYAAAAMSLLSHSQ